jgi:uncharacterized protein DUF2845
MYARTAWLGALIAALLLASAPAHAFRCGTRVISRGDPAAKLLHFCGEPASVQTRLAQRAFATRDSRYVYIPGLAEDVWVEEWTYNFGPSQLMKVVRLENGVVVEVKHLGYGF